MSVEPDANNFIRLFISLEARKDIRISEMLITKSSDVILIKLLESNECFRTSYRKDPDLHKPVINIIPFRTGLFSEKDGSVKHIYTK
jgi:hypothetical protein